MKPIHIWISNAVAIGFGLYGVFDGMALSIGIAIKTLFSTTGAIQYFDTRSWTPIFVSEFIAQVLFLSTLLTIVHYAVSFLAIRVHSRRMARSKRMRGKVRSWTCMAGLTAAFGTLIYQFITVFTVHQFALLFAIVFAWGVVPFLLAVVVYRVILIRWERIFRCRHCGAPRRSFTRSNCDECGAFFDGVPRCSVCDYVLIGNVSGTCSECGTIFLDDARQ